YPISCCIVYTRRGGFNRCRVTGVIAGFPRKIITQQTNRRLGAKITAVRIHGNLSIYSESLRLYFIDSGAGHQLLFLSCTALAATFIIAEDAINAAGLADFSGFIAGTALAWLAWTASNQLDLVWSNIVDRDLSGQSNFE